jgi:hypothetical protein
MPLPFLVVHGAVIAKLLVAACAIAGVAVVTLLLHRRQRRDDRDLAKMRAALAAGPLSAGAAIVRGRLRGSASTRTEIPGDTFDPQHERTANLAVEVADQRVEVDGDVYVASGTRSATCGLAGARRWFAVGDGDDVVVSGTLTQLSPGRWHMAAPTELVAMQPRSCARRPRPFALAAMLALFATIGYGGLRWLGSVLQEHDGYRERTAELSVALQLAAALPHARAAALEDADWQLSDAPRTEQTFQQRLAIAELRDGCAGRARLLTDEGRYEVELATARGCDAASDVTALSRLGRYVEAADRLFRDGALVEAHSAEAVIVAIGAGRWSDAATAAERVADGLAAEPKDTSDSPFLRQLRAEQIGATRCLSDFFRTRSPDVGAAAQAAAVARLVDHGADSHVTACAVARALVLPADQRTAELTAIARAQYGAYDSDGIELARALLDAADVPRTLHDGLAHDPLAWLAPPTLYAYAHAQRALTLGDLAGATAAARTLRDADADTRTELLARIALRTPERPLAATFDWYTDLRLTDAVSIRNGTLAARSMPDREDVAALSAAVRSDGGPLAARLLNINGLDRMAVLAVLPRATSHRPELAEALRLFEPHWVMADPFEVVDDAASRRDLLRLAGTPAAAEPWQRIILGQLAMLADRDKLIALLLWRR